MARITDGGMRMPSVPAEATQPAAKPSSYPWRRISGIATLEKVAAVAIDEPQIAPNAAQAPMVAWMSAPRQPEKIALAASKSSRDMPAREASAPIRIKSGTTESE